MTGADFYYMEYKKQVPEKNPETCLINLFANFSLILKESSS